MPAQTRHAAPPITVRLRPPLVSAAVIRLAVSISSNGGGNQPDPAISISDMILFEGNSGTTDFEFAISLSGSSAKEISVSCDQKKSNCVLCDGVR